MTESMIPEIYDPSTIDEVIKVEDTPDFELTRRLAKVEGLFCGISRGAALVSALHIA